MRSRHRSGSDLAVAAADGNTTRMADVDPRTLAPALRARRSRRRLWSPPVNRSPAAALALALTLAACHPRAIEVHRAPLTLGSTPTRVTPAAPIVVRAPTRQLCLTMDPSQARPEPALSIVLVTATGERDTLGIDRPHDSRPQLPSVISDRPGEVCYWDHGARPPRAYVAVELQAPDSLTVRGVRWWSGRRFAAP